MAQRSGGALCLAGVALSQRTVRRTKPSMHETCLVSTGCSREEEPTMSGLAVVWDSLERDAVNQRNKYGGASSPNLDSARFHVTLPSRNICDKFSSRLSLRRSGDLSAGDNTARSTASAPTIEDVRRPVPRSGKSPRFHMDKFLRWFRDLDTDADGVVAHREVLSLVRRLVELPGSYGHCHGQEEHNLISTREEMMRIREILRDADKTGRGCIEFPDFIDVFSQAGWLIQNEETWGKQMPAGETHGPRGDVHFRDAIRG